MKKKTWIRIIIVVSILVISWFSDWSFADDGSSWLESFTEVLNFAISILSWVWIWFAKWAWEFLTNKWVYWESLKLDTLLWQYWNIVKNFANFWLWFYFLYIVFKSLILKEDVTKKIKDIILWILVAWIWIQASWFLVAAVIDVSTITLVAAGSFPAQVISKSEDLGESIHRSINDYLRDNNEEINEKAWKLFVLFPTNAQSEQFIKTYPITLTWSLTEEELFDNILPNRDSVSWPLYYLGFTILDASILPSVKKAGDEWWKATLVNTILQWWTTIVYALEMLVLLIFSVMRVLYIWIFIILSPLVILLWCIQKWSGWDKSSGSWFTESITKHVNFGSFFWNVFKPTIIVLLMGLTVIFVSLMNKVIVDNVNKNVDIWWVKFVSSEDKRTNLEWDDPTYTTTLDSDLLHFGLIRASQTLLWLFLSIMTVILVYMIIKVWFKMWGWEDFVSSKMKWVQDLVGKWLSMVPIVPVPSYDKQWVPTTRHITAWSIFDFDTGRSKIFSRWYNKKDDDIKTAVSNQVTEVENLFGVSTGVLSDSEIHELDRVWTNNTGPKWLRILDEQKRIINSFNKSWFKLNENALNGRTWINQFTRWLNEAERTDVDDKWKEIIDEWRKEPDKNKRDLKKLFDYKSSFAEKYASYLWYKDEDGPFNGFESIQNLDVFRWQTSSDWE